MALEELSTLTSVQNRANAKRVLGWTDKDGDAIPDPATLAQGFQFATGKIFEYLNQRFGETELASWTLATAPERVLSISDDLCVYWFSSMNNSQNSLTLQIYEDAKTSLENIRDKNADVYGATEAVTTTTVVEPLDDAFEELVYWNE